MDRLSVSSASGGEAGGRAAAELRLSRVPGLCPMAVCIKRCSSQLSAWHSVIVLHNSLTANQSINQSISQSINQWWCRSADEGKLRNGTERSLCLSVLDVVTPISLC